jgi:hypothetical protein
VATLAIEIITTTTAVHRHSEPGMSVLGTPFVRRGGRCTQVLCCYKGARRGGVLKYCA